MAGSSIVVRGAHGGTCRRQGTQIWQCWPLIGRSPSTPESHFGSGPLNGHALAWEPKVKKRFFFFLDRRPI
jgi:hypothetical protein